MAENTASAPTGPDHVEREFAENLRVAAFIFENENNGRFQGSILACKSVARFVYQRGAGPELAAPFLHIATAFEELERGGKPTLFSKKSVAKKERERSPERKHIHMLAAAILEVLVRLKPRRSSIWNEDTRTRDSAANQIARHINKWPGMGVQQVTGLTVIAWRNQQRSLSKTARKPFDTVVEKLLTEQDPLKALDELLKSGPPGYWKS